MIPFVKCLQMLQIDSCHEMCCKFTVLGILSFNFFLNFSDEISFMFLLWTGTFCKSFSLGLLVFFFHVDCSINWLALFIFTHCCTFSKFSGYGLGRKSDFINIDHPHPLVWMGPCFVLYPFASSPWIFCFHFSFSLGLTLHNHFLFFHSFVILPSNVITYSRHHLVWRGLCFTLHPIASSPLIFRFHLSYSCMSSSAYRFLSS